MDEYFGKHKGWIGLGALAIILLCVMMCALGAFFMLATRSGPAYGVVPQVQAPAGEEGAAPPAVTYYHHGPLGMGRGGAFSPFGFLFKLLFGGLILLLLFGLVMRLFWGRRHWAPYYQGKPPKEWKGKPHGMWGPWAWHHHGGPWGPEAEPADEETDPDSGTAEYNGPQE
jgi:hypothetical protein